MTPLLCAQPAVVRVMAFLLRVSLPTVGVFRAAAPPATCHCLLPLGPLYPLQSLLSYCANKRVQPCWLVFVTCGQRCLLGVPDS